jgi:hypothetical protein
MPKPDRKTVLTAVVTEVRNELSLNNPDYRAIGRMIADGLEAIIEPSERVPAEPKLRVREKPNKQKDG